MAEKWFWKVSDNCATFATEIIRAGGGDLSVVLNCPDQEVIRKIGQEVNSWSLGSGLLIIIYLFDKCFPWLVRYELNTLGRITT
jgi:hypothetical protein